MTNFYYLILFLFGLGFGSFLNVVSLRFDPENKVFDTKRIGGRSACPHCHKTLRWYELIPLFSFFVQGGKCRSCGAKLSWQYPIVELLGGLIFVAVPFFSILNSAASSRFLFSYYSIGSWAVWIFILLILLLIALIDLKHFLIPDELNLLLMILGFILVAIESVSGLQIFQLSFFRHYALIFSFGWLNGSIWINHLFAALVASIFFAFIFFGGKEKFLGGGDVKIAFSLGLILGWPDILMAFFIAFVLGGFLGLILIILKKRTMKDLLPLAPFLAIGFCLTVFFGYQLIGGYFSLIGI